MQGHNLERLVARVANDPQDTIIAFGNHGQTVFEVRLFFVRFCPLRFGERLFQPCCFDLSLTHTKRRVLCEFVSHRRSGISSEAVFAWQERRE